MPDTKVVVSQRTKGGNVEIILANGDLFRITFDDRVNFIVVQTVDGSLSILPQVSNEIKIVTNR